MTFLTVMIASVVLAITSAVLALVLHRKYTRNAFEMHAEVTKLTRENIKLKLDLDYVKNRGSQRISMQRYEPSTLTFEVQDERLTYVKGQGLVMDLSLKEDIAHGLAMELVPLIRQRLVTGRDNVSIVIDEDTQAIRVTYKVLI